MHILVLGATGFVGSVLVDHLIRLKDVTITAIVHNTVPATKHEQVRYINHSLSAIDHEFLSAGNYDYIFHLARIPGKKWGDAGRYIAGRKGAAANKKLLANINRLDKQPKLIYLSGSLMYGHIPGSAAIEQDAVNPAGFAKYYYHAERPILKAIEDGAEHLVMLRAPWIIGNGSWYKQMYTDHIKQHNVVPVYGNPQRRMSIITVEDCAGMLWHYAANAPGDAVYNIFTFQDVAYNDLVRQVAKAYNCDSFREIAEDEMKKKMGATVADSINCEVLLDTQHKNVLSSYKPLHTNLEAYIKELAKQ